MVKQAVDLVTWNKTREERQAFFPFYPDMRDISIDNEYAAAIREANDEYNLCFAELN